MSLNQDIARSLKVSLLALALGAVASPRVLAQGLESDATVSGGGTTSSLTNAAVSWNYTDPGTGSYGEASARTDYGYNHAYSKIILPSANPFFSASAVSRYDDTFLISVTHAVEGLLTPTSIVYTLTIDGDRSLPTGFDGSTTISIADFGVANGLVHGSTTDVGASLIETSNQDYWTLSTGVSGTTYTSQSYLLVGGANSIDVLLYAGVNADATSFAGNGYVNFGNTAVLSGIQVYDQHKTLIPAEDLIFHNASGARYEFMPPTPEPSSFAMLTAFCITTIAGTWRTRRRLLKGVSP